MGTLATIRTANRMLGTLAPRFTAVIARRLMMRPHPHRPREWEAEVLAQAERITFRFGLSGLRWGTQGPIVLLMHGWEGRPTQFAAFVPALLARGRQVIAIDAPAHGQSPGREAHVFSFAEALQEAAAELRGGIDAVIGHSMGGSAALMAIEQGLPVRRAVTIGSPAALHRVLDRFGRWIGLPPAAHRAFRGLVDRYVGVTAESVDMQKLGARLTVPGLVIHDEDDDSVPFTEAQALVQAWPRAQLLRTRGLGHRKVLGSKSVVEAVTAFLTDDAPRLHLA
jgi:pimeloyl-ACP methyl ester carboxylesterase